MGITLQDVFLAQRTIHPIAKRTPLKQSVMLSERLGANVYLKLETVQEMGAFKVRGAANKILNLSPDERANGVVTVSTGNHGRAVAYVAQTLGLPATVCLSRLVPQNKVQALQQLGATVVIHGASQDEAEVRAGELQRELGLQFIHPFDDPFIIAGQGTIGLELLQDLPQIDAVLVPLSGGGLIGGIALALKTANPAIRVVGISMERGPAMYHSLQAGQPVEVEEQESLADSLGGGIGLKNAYTFRLVRQFVDEVILLSEDEIADGMAFAFHREGLVVEGAGAVGIAALLHNRLESTGKNIVAIVSGGNVDMEKLLTIATERRGSIWR